MVPVFPGILPASMDVAPYSPSALADGKMKRGLRDKLAEVFGLNGKSTISDNLNGLYLSYQLYKYFRQDIHRIYIEIMNRLDNIH